MNRSFFVIGVTGQKASGKGVFSDRLKQFGFVTRRTSDEIRADLAKRGNKNPTVQELIDRGNMGRKEHGVGYWTRSAIATLRGEGYMRIVIDGIRHPLEKTAIEDVATGRCAFAAIVAPLSVRADRFMKRSRDGDPITFPEFLALDDTDRGIGEPWYGQQVDRTIASISPEDTFNNSHTIESFHRWIDSFVKRRVTPRMPVVPFLDAVDD